MSKATGKCPVCAKPYPNEHWDDSLCPTCQSLYDEGFRDGMNFARKQAGADVARIDGWIIEHETGSTMTVSKSDAIHAAVSGYFDEGYFLRMGREDCDCKACVAAIAAVRGDGEQA